MDQLSAAFAAFLRKDLGLAKGDRIGLQMPNLLQYPVAMFGALRAGLVVVNTNPLYTPREMEHQYKDAGVKAIVILANFARNLQEVLPALRQAGTARHVIVTQVGDLFPGPKRMLVNAAVRYIKKMVPAYDLPGAIDFRDALARGRQPRDVARRGGHERRPGLPAVHRRHHRRLQGGDAHPPQHRRQHGAGGCLDGAEAERAARK